MNKMNKKGFTLIEMLVVIAIIAVLVAIIIPTISSATTKAKAAADAANLRSLVAEATTDMLSGGANTTGLVKFTPADTISASCFEVVSTAPKSKTNGAVATITYDSATGIVGAKYGSLTIESLATTAGS